MTILASSRRAIRSLVYRLGMDRFLTARASRLGASDWDAKLTGEWQSYLDDTTSIAMRDTLIALLIGRRAREASVLDMACAGGSLNQRLGTRPGSYVGVDISKVAIERARQRNPDAEFHVASLEAFEPARMFDAIVFSEVLYYLDVPAAVEQVMRYAGHLKDDGAIVVSMKDDPKSKRIFAALGQRLSWHTGILSQVKQGAPEYSIGHDPARPAFLVGVFEK